MKEFFRHQTLTVLPKHCPKKVIQALFTICCTENMATFPKGKTVYTTNLQPE